MSRFIFFNPFWESIIFQRRGGWTKRIDSWGRLVNICQSIDYVFVLCGDLLVLFNTRTLLRLCHWPNAVMSPTFNGYLTDLTVKGRWHNRSKVHSQTLFFTLRCCFPPFIPSFYVLFRIFPLTRLFTFCQYKFQENKKVELVVM